MTVVFLTALIMSEDTKMCPLNTHSIAACIIIMTIHYKVKMVAHNMIICIDPIIYIMFTVDSHTVKQYLTRRLTSSITRNYNCCLIGLK